MLEFPLLLIFPAAMAFAGAMDLLTMTIPNRVSIVLIAGFVVAAPMAGMTLDAVLNHVAAGALILAIGIVMFSRGWLGGGDAKLMASAALWVGMDMLLTYFAQVALFGGLLAILILLYRRLPFDAWKLPPWALTLHAKDKGIPYGLAIAAAALVIYPKTPWFAAFTA